MKIKLNTVVADGATLEIRTLNSNLLLVLLLSIAVITFAVILGLGNFDIPSYLIFTVVYMVFLAVIKLRIVTVNSISKTIKLTSCGLLGKNMKVFHFSEINEINVSFGKGAGNATSGSVMMLAKGNSYLLTTSDIFADNKSRANKHLQLLNQATGMAVTG